MTLSSTRGLVRISRNPDCDLQTAMVVERVREPEFYRRLTGTDYPGEYGERVSARRRGAKFESNLHQNDAALLREALAPLFGYDPDQMHVRDFEIEVPGVRDSIRAVRLARTQRVFRDLAEGRDAPHVLIQPQLRLPIGGKPEKYFYVSPDFMVLDPVRRTYLPGEEKSFIVRDGEADAADLVITRRQAASQILALDIALQKAGIELESMDSRAGFVLATPYGLKPGAAFLENLDAEIHAIRRSIRAYARVEMHLAALREHAGDTRLENLADDLGKHYQETCVGTCVLAGLCRDAQRHTATRIGDAAAEVLGADYELDRIVELAAGAMPTSERERELAERLADAAEIAGLELGATGTEG